MRIYVSNAIKFRSSVVRKNFNNADGCLTFVLDDKRIKDNKLQLILMVLDVRLLSDYSIHGLVSCLRRSPK